MPSPNIEDTPINWVSEPSSAAVSVSWWGLLGTLIVFVLIFFVALWVVRRLNRSAMRTMNSPWARVLDRQVLNVHQSLYLVEIAGKLQVLGISDHHIVKISEIDDPELAAEILEEIANRPVEKVEGVMAGLAGRIFDGKKRKKNFSAELERLIEEVEK